MSATRPARPDQRRLAAIAITVALHLALIWAWHMSRHPPWQPKRGPAMTIQWLRLPPQARPARPLSPPLPARAQPPQASAAAARPQRAPAGAPVSQVAAEAPNPAPAAPDAPPRPQAPGTPGAVDILQQARRDIGKIDRDLRKAHPERGIRAPANTAQARMEKLFEEAHDLAPPKWYEAPKVKELVDPGGYGRRRYRVVTALGTYCITNESNHSPDGRDPFTRSSVPKTSNCDKDEQPATTQKW